MKTKNPFLIITMVTLTSAVQTPAAPGDLDPTFDGDGKLTTAVSTNDFGMDQAKAVLVQGDGKIIAVGQSENHVALVRYLPGGDLDASFGTGGRVTTMLTENDYFYVNGAALQPDGKIVVVGQVSIATNTTFGEVLVVRYLTNGALDATFGTGGIVAHDLGYDDSGEAVALQADGRIVVAAYGYDFNLSQSHFVAMRLLTNGTPDATFSGDGLAEATFPGSELAHPTAVLVQGNAKILLAGYSSVTGVNQIALARFEANGTPDSGFGTAGVVSTSFGTTNAVAAGVAIQPDGRIVVAGSASQMFDGWLLAARYQTNGVVDPSFSGDGTAFMPGAGATSVALQSDGKILMAGWLANDTGLFRFNADGSPDGSFGASGQVQTALSPAQDGAAALALQPDGKIIVAGGAFVNSAFVFTLARFVGDGAAPANPELNIVRSGSGEVLISWSPAAPGFVLQERASLGGGSWTNSPSGGMNPVLLPAAPPARFYRLFKP